MPILEVNCNPDIVTLAVPANETAPKEEVNCNPDIPTSTLPCTCTVPKLNVAIFVGSVTSTFVAAATPALQKEPCPKVNTPKNNSTTVP